MMDPLIVCYIPAGDRFALGIDVEALTTGADLKPSKLQSLANRIERGEVNKVILTNNTCTGFRVRLRREVTFVYSKNGPKVGSPEIQAAGRFINKRSA